MDTVEELNKLLQNRILAMVHRIAFPPKDHSDDPVFGVILRFLDESSIAIGVEGDCCSKSWIEHLTVPDLKAGATVFGVVAYEMPDIRLNSDTEHDVTLLYELRIRTSLGDVVMEYRNYSNGFYGGYPVILEKAGFAP